MDGDREGLVGMSRRNRELIKLRAVVPTANNSRYCPVLSPNTTLEMAVNTKALNPNMAKGNAVAVPRCVGQL